MRPRLLLLPLAAAGVQAVAGVVGRDRLPDSLAPSLPTADALVGESRPAIESPLPTNLPRPSLASMELLKRAGGDPTCGYLHSNLNPGAYELIPPPPQSYVLRPVPKIFSKSNEISL